MIIYNRICLNLIMLVLTLLNNMGFKINNENIKLNSLSQIKDFYERILSIRNDLDYDIDGLVYKVNDRVAFKKIQYNKKEVVVYQGKTFKSSKLLKAIVLLSIWLPVALSILIPILMKTDVPIQAHQQTLL